MKLKFNKNFKACPVDYDDEIYPNGIFHFNITKMIEYIQKNNFPVEQVSVKEVRKRFSTDLLDETTILNAKVENPIILGEIAPNRFNVIDGNHRLERAHRDGLETIPAYRISPKDHMQFLTDERSYEIYVSYWNEKLKD